MTTKQLTRRQVRWSEFLSEFDFKIIYRPGKQGGKPDVLTRRSQDLPRDRFDARIQHQNQTLLKPHHFDPDGLELAAAEPTINTHSTSTITRGFDSEESTTEKIEKEMTQDKRVPHSKEVSLSECEIKDGKLFFRERCYAPSSYVRTFLLQTAHDSFETGHAGKHKLYEIVSREWWWPNLSKDCAQFTRNCNKFKRNQNSKLRYQGALKPLPLPAFACPTLERYLCRFHRPNPCFCGLRLYYGNS
ncbi:hypothetical protein K3495_g16261 [Podosphaera aphanis]|nr:hypothetical protein K3495_g16261 [Podosphaera aphanis]